MNFSNIDLKQEASKKEKLYFFIILFLVVVMFARIAWLPKMGSIKEKRLKIQSVKLQATTLQKFINEKLKEKPVQNEATEPSAVVGDQLERLIEKSKDKSIAASNLVDVLTSPASLKGLRLISINFGSENSKEGFYILPMELEISGFFRSFCKYMEQIQTFPNLLTIDNINVKTGPRGKSEVLAKLSLSLYIVGKPSLATQLKKEAAEVVKPAIENSKGKNK